LEEFRALSAEERKHVAETILIEEDSWISESFRQGMEDIAADRVMEMETVLREEPPAHPNSRNSR